MRRSMLDSLEAVRGAARVRKLKDVFFGTPRSRGEPLSVAVFSNWRKATLFDDINAAKKISEAPSPTAAKALGRGVRGFDQVRWDAQRLRIAVDGCLAKFSAHADLRRVLLGTQNCVIAEASPVDRVWGIGLPQSHESAKRPEAWRGLNLLGFALMDVRERLR